MLFSEIYGAYFRVLTEILARAAEGTLTRQEMEKIIRDRGFAESALTIGKNLEDQTWPLLDRDMATPLEHRPDRPLTTLEKRWLKGLLQDPRIRLFDPPRTGLEDVEPLYPREAVVYFDRYGDPDPYEDETYIRNFRNVLTALREKRWVRLHFTGRKGEGHIWRCVPHRLEYSPKDDKFRLITANRRTVLTVNMGRVLECQVLEPCGEGEYCPRTMEKRAVTLELTDERNALERCLLHFSHLEKETRRIGPDQYRLTLRYEKDDETELLIRVLSFGPLVRVTEPEGFIRLIRQRLEMQKELKE